MRHFLYSNENSSTECGYIESEIKYTVQETLFLCQKSSAVSNSLWYWTGTIELCMFCIWNCLVYHDKIKYCKVMLLCIQQRIVRNRQRLSYTHAVKTWLYSEKSVSPVMYLRVLYFRKLHSWLIWEESKTGFSWCYLWAGLHLNIHLSLQWSRVNILNLRHWFL